MSWAAFFSDVLALLRVLVSDWYNAAPWEVKTHTEQAGGLGSLRIPQLGVSTGGCWSRVCAKEAPAGQPRALPLASLRTHCGHGVFPLEGS